jgi:trigger factor
MSTYTVSYLPKSIIEAKLVIDTNDIDAAYKKALKGFCTRTQLPGFRKGKAPEQMVESYVGKEKIYEQTLNTIIPDQFETALKEDQKASKGRIVILSAPSYKIENEWKPGAPLEVTATAVIYPRFEIDSVISKLRVKKGIADAVEEKEVDEAIGKIFEQYKKIKKAEKEKGKLSSAESNDQQIGEEISLDMDDTFAQAAGAKNLDDLKKSVREELNYEKQTNVEKAFEEEVLKKAQEMTEIDIPELLIQEEMNRIEDRFKSQLSRIGTTFEKYIETEGKTKDEVTKDWYSKAYENTKIALILQEIRVVKELKVTDEEIKFVAAQNGITKGITQDQYNTLSYVVGQSKALNELKSIASQE